MNKLKVLVIGASGLVGNHLLKQLALQPHIGQVVALTRRPLTFQTPKVDNQVIDFNNLGLYEELFIGDILFSCLGTTKKQAGSIAAQRLVEQRQVQNAPAKLGGLVICCTLQGDKAGA